VITPDMVVFDGDAIMVQYPGEDGLYGVLANHAAMITTVDAGVITLETAPGQKKRLFVSRGFAQIKDNEMRFAVDSGEPEEVIDIERARAAAERAKELLKDRMRPDVDLVRAEYALRRALMRLRTRQAPER
jgi:F-type H+-transporting ATPase subunit epsilon